MASSLVQFIQIRVIVEKHAQEIARLGWTLLNSAVIRNANTMTRSTQWQKHSLCTEHKFGV